MIQNSLEALGVLRTLGVTWTKSEAMLAVTFLAYAGMTRGMKWEQATNPRLTVSQAMERITKDWGIQYAPNTRETIRAQCVRLLLEQGIFVANPDDPSRSSASPKYCYQLTDDTLELLRLL